MITPKAKDSGVFRDPPGAARALDSLKAYVPYTLGVDEADELR